MPSKDQSYGNKSIKATDPEGHLTQARSWFEEWRCEGEFARQVKSLAELIPSHQYWTRGSTKWLREAWSLARYCELSEFTHVRLQTPDPPDAYVRSAGESAAVLQRRTEGEASKVRFADDLASLRVISQATLA